jgi:outer membrane protein
MWVFSCTIGAWLLLSVVVTPHAAIADTLEWAIIQAYKNNPQINSQRAAVRATDENVPQALSGYRPRISLSGSAGEQYLDVYSKTGSTPPYSSSYGAAAVTNYGITGTQTLLNGFQTANRTRQAESQVSAAREALRLAEHAILLNAVTAYMNLIRDAAILDLQRSNVEVLTEQLRQTQDRFKVGEVTRTDVAQAESRLAGGRATMLSAQSSYVTSRAAYRQIIGVEAAKLAPATPVDRLSPRAPRQAVEYARAKHPSVTVAMFNVDAAILQVKIAEGALYPTLSLQANAQQTNGPAASLAMLKTSVATITGQLTVPIYQGGGEYSTIRQAKEILGQRRLDLDTAREQAQQNVVQSWGQLEAAKAQIKATESQVASAEIALNGVREEARVGQRTTLDVLNSQQELVNARVALVTAQHDRVVASFALLASVGRLTIPVLGLKVPAYDPMVHYQQVRDSWIGVRTPDGK